eukprot:Lithocolla_globosa_v1_NODE_5845_length_1176_cov_154.438894.p3 type:complete len:108 gc:universal NODE_5845_length_1176_cov_154.438894:554-231(-)
MEQMWSTISTRLPLRSNRAKKSGSVACETRSRMSCSRGMGSPLSSTQNSMCPRQFCVCTSPVQLVVRSSRRSWCTITTRSRVSRRSNSMPCDPTFSASLKAVSEFSA